MVWVNNSTPPSRYRDRNSTADKALDILSLFSETQTTIGAAELAEQLSVARSTAYRYVQSLVQAGFLEETGSGRFRLGRRILELALLARRGFGLSEVAVPIMRRLSEDIGETVLLTRLAGSAAVCLEREEQASSRMRISYERGQVLPLNAGASAFVLLAWLDEATLDRLLDTIVLTPFTPSTLTTREALRSRLGETATQGYGISRGELDLDVLGIAAPIFGSDSSVVAAISVAAVASRVPAAREPEIINAVLVAGRAVSRELELMG